MTAEEREEVRAAKRASKAGTGLLDNLYGEADRLIAKVGAKNARVIGCGVALVLTTAFGFWLLSPQDKCELLNFECAAVYQQQAEEQALRDQRLAEANARYQQQQAEEAAILAERVAAEAATKGCREAILRRLRDPHTATIVHEAGLKLGLWGEGEYYKVRAQNGFGGMQVERWECYTEDGIKKAMPI